MRSLCVLVVVAPLLLWPALAAAQTASGAPEAASLTLSAGGVAWSGDYGSSVNTQIDAALLSARYRLGPLRFTASLPWMRIDSPGAVFTGINATPLIVSPVTSPYKTVRSGLGDLTLGASYLFEATPLGGADVELITEVKAPTGSTSRGISTGAADVSFGTEVSRAFGRVAPFVSVAYRRFGDARGFPIRDGFATSVGASYVFPSGVVTQVSFDHADRTTRFVGDADEFVASASSKLWSSGLRATAFISGGLSSGASDVSGGLSVSRAF